MAKLPKQVQDELDAAEKVEQEIGNPQPPAPDPNNPPAPEPEATPVPEPAPAPAAPEPAPPPQPDATDWQQRFQTLQGMQKADQARFNAEIATLKSRVEELTQQLAAAQKPQEPAPEPAKPPSLVTAADAEAFGPDMIDLIQRAAREIAAAEMGPLKSELAAVKAENAELKGTVTTVATQQNNVGKAAFFADLDRLVPDWRTTNESPAFLDWLAQTDAFSGLVRQVVLEDAYNQLDAHRVATVFTTFKPTASPAPAPQPAPRDTLTTQVQPGQTRASVPPTPPQQPKTWTPDDIEQFYAQVARGEFKGRDAEAERIEAEIDRSLAATA